MRFQGGEGFSRGHVRNEAHVDFCEGAAGENGFAAGAGVTADETFDVDGRARGEQFKRFLETYIVNPVLDAEEFFGFGGEAFDGGIVAVGRDERGEGFDEMPRGAVEAGFVAGVHVLARAAAPLFAAGNEFELDDTFGAEELGNFAIETLRREWREARRGMWLRGLSGSQRRGR